MEITTKKVCELSQDEKLKLLKDKVEMYQKMVIRISGEINQWLVDDMVDDNFRTFMLQSLIAGRKNFEDLVKAANQAYLEKLLNF